MSEEEAKGTLKTMKENIDKKYLKTRNSVAIETALNLLEKKDKIIDLIAKELVKAHEWFYSEFDNYTKEDFIKYFERKVENEN